MPDYLDNVFGQQGYLSNGFDNYMPRTGQVVMATKVDAAIANETHLIVEGPCGTGKGIAYSVPAIHHAVQHEKQVVIATANIALQEQLITKDLPLLQQILPDAFTFAMLKGKNNFFCHDRYYEGLAKGTLPYSQHPDDTDQLHAILEWSKSTETGDKSELPFEPPFRLWSQFSTGSEDCKGKDCKSYDECFYRKASKKAFSADIIVTNYHLLFAHLHVRDITGMNIILPQFDVAILDEAHKAADIARDFFGFKVTAGSVRWVSRKLEDIGKSDLKWALHDEAAAFFDALKQFKRSFLYNVRLRHPGAVSPSELCKLLAEASKAYQIAAADEDKDDDKADFNRLAKRCTILAEQIQAAIALDDSESVYFIDEDSKGRSSLCCKPIHVAERLRQSLFGETDTVIITSATLSTGNSFRHVRKEMGIEKAEECVAESPFDFNTQALLIVPEGLPSPTDREFPDAVAETVADVVELADGRTLGLFTSYRNMRRAGETLSGCKHVVFCQGDEPRTRLVKKFREDVDSVLLGTESFWTGVDVSGESLSCVVIDRLPFPNPDDPVLDAITERDPNWFRNYSLPRAVIAFKQGFGRLIRSTSDRGVVVLLDKRIVHKRYGKLFLESLPPVMKSRTLLNIPIFLNSHAKQNPPQPASQLAGGMG